MSKKYDYLIVGSGLFGAVFAYEAKKEERNALLSKGAITLPAIFIAKMCTESMCINTARIFSTQATEQCGII